MSDWAAGRVAVVAFTRHGTRLAGRIAQGMPGAEVWVDRRFVNEAPDRCHAFDEPVRSVVEALFHRRCGLVVVASVGLVVRLLAPHVRDKAAEPGVVAVDEAGRFAVSVLSGHRGGANALAERVAAASGAQAVVTTASESRGVPSADLIGRDLGWTVENPEALRRLSAALVNGEPVGIYQDAGEPDWWPGDLPAHVTRYRTLPALAAASPAGAVIITDRALDPAHRRDGWVLYRPPTLVVGIGCVRGAAAAAIASAVYAALEHGGLSPLSLREVASIDLKRDEVGLLEFARHHGLRLRTYPAEELAAVPGMVNPSDVVRSAVGTPGVAEPAALLAASAGDLVVPKLKHDGVTVAVARRGNTTARGDGAGMPEETGR